MRITELTVNQLRQFREPITLSDLDEGLNVIVGPNESGKSTLVSAIRAAFFERYKSNSVKDLQPWGDSSAAPEISLDFEWQGERWSLQKRFLKRQRCDLSAGREKLDGEDAEDRLAELLGFQYSARGASKAEHWGVPGLLWVEQGQTQDINAPVTHAASQLQSVLSDQLGDVASTQGDALLERIEQLSRELLTATGLPNKTLKDAQKADDDAQQVVRDLNARINEYDQQVDELGRLMALQSDQDSGEPWKALRLKVSEAQQKLQQVEQWQQNLTGLLQTEQEVTHQIGLYREKLQSFDEQSAQLDQRADAHRQATAQRQRVEARESEFQKSLSEARQHHKEQESLARTVRQAGRYRYLQSELQQLLKQQAQLDNHLQKAQAIQEGIDQLVQQRSTLVDNPGALKQLKSVEDDLSRLSIEQATLASRIHYQLEAGQQATLNGQVISGAGEAALTQRTEVNINGVGVLVFEPGGSDIADLQRQTERLKSKRLDYLQQLNVQSIDEAIAQAEQAKELKQTREQQLQQLAIYAPEGLDALSLQLRDIQQQISVVESQLSECPAIDEALPGESLVEKALDDANDALRDAEAAWQQYQLDIAKARQYEQAAQHEWQQLAERLNAPDRAQKMTDAQNQMADLQVRHTRLKQEIQQQQQKIDSANPDVLKQDIERFARSADSLEQEARARTRQIDRLQSQLEQTGALGLHDALDNAQAEAMQANKRRNELERRANALKLLLDELRQARQALTRKLQAPLQKHLNHYLNLLFSGADIIVDDQLRPSVLNRQSSDAEAIHQLSFGAREQMGMICRLAYADLLREAGRPTLIILDDALVHSDAERLDQMKRILFDAATRHQVLLFSCHPENWRDLGVPSRDLQALKLNSST